MSELTPLLIGLVGTVIGSLPMLISALANRGKTHVENDSVLVKTALDLLSVSKEQADEAEDWHRKFNKANACAQTLYYFCIDHNLIPPCTPEGVTGKLQ